MAKRFRPPEEDVESELNLVPYLDIMMNLIMFMLFSTTGLTQMGVINISLPQYGGGAPTPPPGGTPKPEETAEIALLVTDQGYTVQVNGVEVDGKEGEPTLKVRSEGEYDYETLTERMADLKSTYPAQSTLLLSAGESINYEVIVATMDATREIILMDAEGNPIKSDGPANRILYPDIVLSAF